MRGVARLLLPWTGDIYMLLHGYIIFYVSICHPYQLKYFSQEHTLLNDLIK